MESLQQALWPLPLPAETQSTRVQGALRGDAFACTAQHHNEKQKPHKPRAQNTRGHRHHHHHGKHVQCHHHHHHQYCHDLTHHLVLQHQQHKASSMIITVIIPAFPLRLPALLSSPESSTGQLLRNCRDWNNSHHHRVTAQPAYAALEGLTQRSRCWTQGPWLSYEGQEHQRGFKQGEGLAFGCGPDGLAFMWRLQ